MRREINVSLLVILMLLGVMTSCKDGLKSNFHIIESDTNMLSAADCIITDDPETVGITYAMLKGTFIAENLCNYFNSPITDYYVGCEVSSSEFFTRNTTESNVLYSRKNGLVTSPITGLTANTKYYYRLFFIVGITRLYGSTRTFTTLQLPLTCSTENATNITFTTAKAKVKFNALVSPPSETEQITAGVAYTTNSRFFSDTNLTVAYNELDLSNICFQEIPYSESEVTTEIKGLVPGKTYYYSTYSRGGNACVFGPMKKFTTVARDPSHLVTLDVPEAETSCISAILKASTTLPNTLALLYPDSTVNYSMSYTTEEDYYETEYNADEVFPNIVPAEIVRGSSGDTIIARVADLEANKKYVFRPCVVVGSTRLYGDVKKFTTRSSEGVLSIESVKAKFVRLKVQGNSLLPQWITGITYYFNYGWASDPMKVNGNQLTLNDYGSLTPGNSYDSWITAKKGNRIIAKSDVFKFRAESPSDHIYVDEASDVTATTAVISCKLGSVVCVNNPGVDYGAGLNYMYEGHSLFPEGDHYSYKLTNLRPGTTYYFRIRINVDLAPGLGDTFYSEIKSFTTLSE